MTATTSIPTVKLSTHIEMPLLGFGVFQIPPEGTESVVSDALAAGYRSLDTAAAAYRNEEAVGAAPSRAAASPTTSSSSPPNYGSRTRARSPRDARSSSPLSVSASIISTSI